MSDNNELVQATRDAQEATTLLLNITHALRDTMDGKPIEAEILMPFVDVRIDLEDAIYQYVEMNNRWVEMAANL